MTRAQQLQNLINTHEQMGTSCVKANDETGAQMHKNIVRGLKIKYSQLTLEEAEKIIQQKIFL